MLFTNYAGLLLLCLSQSMVISRADWLAPRLLSPDPKEDVIQTWNYEPERASIWLEEEVDHAVCIAILNYGGSEVPDIGPLEEGKSNLVLGAEVRKNESTGQLSLWITETQDYETPIMQDYRFQIIAGSPPYPTIMLNIVNIDDNAPVVQPNERNCKIEENYTGKSNCTFIVTDADGWIDQVNVTLSSVSNNAGTNNFDFITSRVTGAMEEYALDAYLNVTESLDFETISMYMLLIRAIVSHSQQIWEMLTALCKNESSMGEITATYRMGDGGGNESNLTTVVEVIDMPDEPPMWTSLTAAEYISEKSRKNFSVSAVDGDIQIDATINYRIEVDDEGEEKYFMVDQETGVITINPIDRDVLKKEVFRFVIVAYEVPEPDSKINATIIVIVDDLNDHVPEISPKNLTIDILEETYMTLEFDPSITIEDPDLAANAQFSVSLMDDSKYNWSSAFLVVPNTGYQQGVFTISIVDASLLDYEDENWRNVTIKLRAEEKADPSHVDIRDINIQLINWNDELPIFDPDTPLSVNIPEDVEAGHSIATMHATDRDIDDKVMHSLMAQLPLMINEDTGKIVTTQNDALDYESMHTVVLQAVATDLGDHKTYATLTINVTDVNDVPPKLNLPKLIPKHAEEQDVGSEVNALINATDVDTDAELFFSINWDSTTAHKSSVQVDESLYRGNLNIRTDYPEGHKRKAVGTIYQTGRIDYEAFDVMFLTIAVTDKMTVHNENTTSASMTLNITDINDNWPVFNEVERMDVVENQVTDALIGAVTATDADGWQYNNVSYSIKPINGTKYNLVYINPLTGVIRVELDKGIDAEEYEYIYYNVTASDGENESFMAIEIYVIDQNDEVPYLVDHELFNSTFFVREKSPSGTEIITISGKDKDRTHPFNYVSYLINSEYSAPMDYFSINKDNGRLEVNLTCDNTLDRDFGLSKFTLNLELRDNFLDYSKWNTNSFPYTVTVILQDINDQKPLLPEQKKPFEVSETMKKNGLVTTVVAKDYDDPTTNNTKVFYEIRSIKSANEVSLDDSCKDLFYVKSRDESAADIYANCDLKGYYGQWTVELYAQDRGTDPGPLNHTRKYDIQVTDFNYNSPVIEFPSSRKKIPLRVEQMLHAQLITYDDQRLNDFVATDLDYGNSGTVTFSLPDTDDNEYFDVVPNGKNVAQLQLIKAVHPEKQTYNLNLTATDGGNPSRAVSQIVTIVFVSSLGPKFDENEWTVWIKENKEGVGEYGKIPEAHDMVSDEGENTVDIFYFFESKDGDMKFFDLDKDTRMLTVVDDLDREKQEIMTIVVIATTDKNGPPRNPLEDSILTITVIVLDVNDNPPIFEKDSYMGGVAMEDALDKIILTVKATDADINETLTYSFIDDNVGVSDNSLSSVSHPFSINSQTGDLLLKFTPTSNMKGYFDLNIVVYDAVEHNDTVRVQVYIIAASNRVVFTFRNTASYVKEQTNFIIESFNSAFKYMSSIDDIKSAVGDNNEVLDNMTSMTTHFINEKNNLPIKSDAVIVAAGDLQTISNLKETLLTKSLRLVDVPTGASSSSNNVQNTVQWILVSLTTFFGLCCTVLIVVYVIRTKRLTQRLDKLAVTKYGSQESGIDKAGAVPTTNQFKEAGSNPMWKTKEEIVDDNISQGSGDSDLIGVEDNPDFGYTNEAFREDDVWENLRRGSVNPVLANHDTTFNSRNLEPLESSPQDYSTK